MNNTQIITTLNHISLQINQIVPLFIIITGTFGHIWVVPPVISHLYKSISGQAETFHN